MRPRPSSRVRGVRINVAPSAMLGFVGGAAAADILDNAGPVRGTPAPPLDACSRRLCGLAGIATKRQRSPIAFGGNPLVRGRASAGPCSRDSLS